MINRYAPYEMELTWVVECKLDIWFEIEMAALWEMEEAGHVPQGTHGKLESAWEGETLALGEMGHLWNTTELEFLERTTRHDFVAFLRYLENHLGEDARYLHLGMTTSDVVDTAFAVQLVEATHLIMRDILELRHTLLDLAKKYKHVSMIGRTHGMHAQPITLGLVFLRWFAALDRDLDRLDGALERLKVGKLSGAVGVYGEKLTPEIEERVLKDFRLKPECPASQIVARDRHAEFFNTLAILGSNIEMMATTIRHWQRTEVGEASEVFQEGQKGSSAMPHKRNPIGSENLCGLSRLLRGYALTAMENINLWHERDISHSSVERVIAPDATCIVDHMVIQLTSILKNLVIREDRIEQNLELARPGLASEVCLSDMVSKGWSRADAHEVISQMGDTSTIASFDTKAHLKWVNEIFERAMKND